MPSGLASPAPAELVLIFVANLHFIQTFFRAIPDLAWAALVISVQQTVAKKIFGVSSPEFLTSTGWPINLATSYLHLLTVLQVKNAV